MVPPIRQIPKQHDKFSSPFGDLDFHHIVKIYSEWWLSVPLLMYLSSSEQVMVLIAPWISSMPMRLIQLENGWLTQPLKQRQTTMLSDMNSYYCKKNKIE